jgi:hypothetical protein
MAAGRAITGRVSAAARPTPAAVLVAARWCVMQGVHVLGHLGQEALGCCSCGVQLLATPHFRSAGAPSHVMLLFCDVQCWCLRSSVCGRQCRTSWGYRTQPLQRPHAVAEDQPAAVACMGVFGLQPWPGQPVGLWTSMSVVPIHDAGRQARYRAWTSMCCRQPWQGRHSMLWVGVRACTQHMVLGWRPVSGGGRHCCCPVQHMARGTATRVLGET